MTQPTKITPFEAGQWRVGEPDNYPFVYQIVQVDQPFVEWRDSDGQFTDRISLMINDRLATPEEIVAAMPAMAEQHDDLKIEMLQRENTALRTDRELLVRVAEAAERSRKYSRPRRLGADETAVEIALDSALDDWIARR